MTPTTRQRSLRPGQQECRNTSALVSPSLESGPLLEDVPATVSAGASRFDRIEPSETETAEDQVLVGMLRCMPDQCRTRIRVGRHEEAAICGFAVLVETVAGGSRSDHHDVSPVHRAAPTSRRQFRSNETDKRWSPRQCLEPVNRRSGAGSRGDRRGAQVRRLPRSQTHVCIRSPSIAAVGIYRRRSG